MCAAIHKSSFFVTWNGKKGHTHRMEQRKRILHILHNTLLLHGIHVLYKKFKTLIFRELVFNSVKKKVISCVSVCVCVCDFFLCQNKTGKL